MKQYLNVKGTQEIATEIEVNVDTVYVRTNIVRIETEELTGWQYDEIQYDKNEYIENIHKLQTENTKLKQENEILNMSVLTLESINEMNMMAMTEMYEDSLKLNQENSTTMLAVTELYEMLMGGL